MSKMYAVSVILEIKETDVVGTFTRTVPIPTFFLLADVQGIRDKDHAEQIARGMFKHGPMSHNIKVNVSAVETSMYAHGLS